MLKGQEGMTGFASILSRAVANIHQEKKKKKANIQGFAFHQNNSLLG